MGGWIILILITMMLYNSLIDTNWIRLLVDNINIKYTIWNVNVINKYQKVEYDLASEYVSAVLQSKRMVVHQ